MTEFLLGKVCDNEIPVYLLLFELYCTYWNKNKCSVTYLLPDVHFLRFLRQTWEECMMTYYVLRATKSTFTIIIH